MRKILFICALVMTLTTAYSQNRQIVVDKVNVLQAREAMWMEFLSEFISERREEEIKHEIENNIKIRDKVRFIEAQETCFRGSTVTKMLFIAMQTYASPLDTVIKIITNVKTFCNSKSFSMPLVEFNNAIMVIETVDNEIITLYSTGAAYYIELRPSMEYTKDIFSNRHYWKTSLQNIYRHLHYWNISVENINKLKSGVKKIKIKSNCGKGLYEKEFEKDKIGTILYDGYLSELKQMAKDKNQDFKDNF